jgi:IclR family transcriptional regulator, arginine deiminase pathway regulator
VYCTAAGKALLGRLPAAEQRKLIAELSLGRCGPRTIKSKSMLQAELQRISREGGVAVEDEELRGGRRGLGVAVVRKVDGWPAAAVELVVPAEACSREDLVGCFGAVVGGAADRIGLAL